MVPIRGEWTRFKDLEDQIDHCRLWGLIPEKSNSLRPVMVVDSRFDFPEPCQVVGYQTDKVAVIELPDGFHAVRGEHLVELQPQPYQNLGESICFVEVLSNYVVVDIETTGFNHSNDRIIEIAAAKYEYGQLSAKFQALVNPGMLLPADIVQLTGITQAEVDGAPMLEDISADFLAFIGTLPLVGHNAVSFDIPFLSSQLQVDILNTVVDTLPMARGAFPRLPRFGLEYLKSVFEFDFGPAHRAMADVETTNALLWACLAPNRYEQKMWSAYLKAVLSGEKVKRKSKPSSPSANSLHRVDIKAIKPRCDANPNHPLFNKNIVFTGELSIPRKDAMQMAVDCGAVLKSSVSSKTNYLVVGAQDMKKVGDDGVSNKELDAKRLNNMRKANIDIISEAEFMVLIKSECGADEVDQIDFFETAATEEYVYSLLLPVLTDVLRSNNAGTNNIKCERLKNYSSVSYQRYEPFFPVEDQKPADTLAFRICCRGNHHYFGISSTYAASAPAEINQYITRDGRSDGYVNYEFDPTADGILVFADFLASVLDMVLDTLPKEFDCCSRYEECSNKKCCLHPHPGMATSCGYRKILKSGRIFYGPNRNID